MANLAEDLWKRLKGYKQELLNLKQVKRVSTNSKYYIFKVEGNVYYNTWEITYEAGDQPIISELLSYYDSSLSVPVNNKQYIFSFAQVASEITVLSTRKIISIRGIQ